MPPVSDDVLSLELAALEAWRAEEVAELGPWRLRFMHGVTNRANSVWAGPGVPAGGFEAAFAVVEDWYAARGLPASYQVAPLADPRLDGLLAARGYQRLPPVSVEAAAAETVAALRRPAGIRAQCVGELDEAWFAVSGHRGRFQGEQSRVYRAFLERLGGRAGFASAGGAEIGAVGLTVVAPRLAGVFSMLTLPDQRRRGLAAAVLAEIARFALSRGATRLYLQVEADNAPARSLYARAGFAVSHRYHYRRRALPG
jgi:GNAT superfamily N-acetyltransferase